MKKILVIDDEKEAADLIKKKLQQNNYITQAVYSGQGGLEISKTFKPDLILLDIVMPVMNGYEVCEKLKTNPQTKDIPVLLLTAQDLDTQAIAKRYEELGVAGYIAKPSMFSDILNKIREIIG